MRWRRHWAIRGATTAACNEADAIVSATSELLERIVEANDVQPDEIVSALFTVTRDLTAAFPARAARELGWCDVPLLCMTEIPVPDDLPLCIRVLVQIECAEPREQEIVHVYLGDAAALRPDLAGSH